MNTRIVMSGSALVLGAAGIGATFFPHEWVASLGLPSTGVLPVVVQLHAALLLGFAMLNWMAKDSAIGGIYNRPLAIGNLVHFLVGAIALLKYVAAGARPAYVLVAAVIYAVFAVAFAMVMLRSPVKNVTVN
jgi:hypothetical protein